MPAISPTLPFATLALTTAVGTTFYNQISVALGIAGLNALAAGADSTSIYTYCLSPTQSVIQRTALRVLAGMASAVPSDATVLTAVAALIPASGAFLL